MTGRTAVSALAATLALAATPAVASAQDAPVEPVVPAATTATVPADPAAVAAAPRSDADAPPEPKAKGEPQPGDRRRAAAPQAGGRIGVWLDGEVYRLGRETVTVPGKDVEIGGRIVPYVPNQKVTIRVWNGSRLAKQVTVTPKPSKTKQTATFSARFTAGKPGEFRVFATHARTPEQRELASKAAAVDVVAPVAGFGTRSAFVGILQQKLAKLGYAVPRNGVYDGGTGRAIEAYRKVNGMSRLQTLDAAVVDKLLRGVGGFKVRYPQHGRHVEAHLGQQVLALIENGKVYRAYTTSSGASVTPTVLGNFRFYWKQPGVNNREMVHSSYFIRGYAIHGYKSVPTYPASHGCLRIPIPDALFVYNWVRLGDQIDVYY
ncbi:L,D-transpeptidase family protein [Conexibacter woesei]|uniref:ErfK/YbiS/YcfS/YnhG family protein n=1 Tax=Conexibacter woesei (strain DSM 14684 / CCUG 47730 / CIP 108061 / JCM 11494 / NBRC 100937 / ID131577) TaxID=469383 RepID=D3F3R9_CONWI|nr:L,D-transpeptidase family protein [Conexibacter woesei]ADB54294.1 ErfK/YbiS/YcfS/YnhG family protein [Conexibacter woesei DSM 14684]